MSSSAPLTFLAVMAATHGLYAESFLRAIKARGHRLLVITRAEALDYAWPREAIDGLYAVPDIFNRVELQHAVAYLMRGEAIDRLIGPGEYDVELAAGLREHFRLPGMSESVARHFRDKLAMRDRAQRQGVRVPAFVPAFNHAAIAAFLERVPGPWVLKPRMEASSKGIQLLQRPEEVWQAVHGLGDRASDHLLERYIAGDVFHVDGVIAEGQVLFAAAHRYGKPILDLHRHGGVYTTHRLQVGSDDERALDAANRAVVSALGLEAGVTHIEFIKGRDDGQFYFLEAGARVGAGLIEEMVEAESGLNLWAEWAHLEEAACRPPYALPPTRERYAGVLATSIGQEHPDARPYLGPDVQALPTKPYHLGLLVTADSAEQVASRLAELARRVGDDLMVHH